MLKRSDDDTTESRKVGVRGVVENLMVFSFILN